MSMQVGERGHALHRLDHRTRARRNARLNASCRSDSLTGGSQALENPAYSKKLATAHFWIGDHRHHHVPVSMWVAGITQWGDVARVRARMAGSCIPTSSRLSSRSCFVLGPFGGRGVFLRGAPDLGLQRVQDDKEWPADFAWSLMSRAALGVEGVVALARTTAPTRTTTRFTGPARRAPWCPSFHRGAHCADDRADGTGAGGGLGCRGHSDVLQSGERSKRSASVKPYKPLELLGATSTCAEGLHLCTRRWSAVPA